jgi:hypothetical protein
MHLLRHGVVLTQLEYDCFKHGQSDPEQVVLDNLNGKVKRRSASLIGEWLPKLQADHTITKLPATTEGLCKLIMGQPSYQTNAQKETARVDRELVIFNQLNSPDQVAPQVRPPHNRGRYAEKVRSGKTVVLFPAGITLDDDKCNYLYAFITDIDDWLLGAILGHVNRGKKKMIQQYHPIIMADASVTTMPATEDGLITMILARPDYRSLIAT